MAGRQTRKAQQQILDLLSEDKENLVILPKYIMISLLQENTKYFSIVANLQEKTLEAFNTFSKSINESNNNITGKNKAFTESIDNLLFQITTTNKTLLDNSTRERNILIDTNNDVIKEVEKRKRLHYQ